MSVSAPLQTSPVTPEHSSLSIGSGLLQHELTIGASNDPLEREADRIAGQVLVTPEHPAVNSARPRIQRLSGQPTGQQDAAPAIVDQALASPGRPLEPALRRDMERRFGHDFNQVRVHSGAAAERSAQDMDARADTVGQSIVFGASVFAPGTHTGRKLLAHELTHVVQQTRANISPYIARQQMSPPPWHEEALRAISSFAGPSNGKTADDKWPKMVAFFCALPPNRARSLWQRFQGGDSFANYMRQKFPAHHESLIAALDVISNRKLPGQCREPKIETVFEKIEVLTPPAVCGPDVTPQITQALDLTRKQFKGWSIDEKENHCSTLTSSWSGGTAWDIDELHNQGWLMRYQPECVVGGPYNSCRASVWVQNGCYYPGSVNYVLFGTMFRLCFDHYVAKGRSLGYVADFSESSMLNLIQMYKGTKIPYIRGIAANFRDSQRWALVGFARWPLGASAPPPDRGACEKCKLDYIEGRKPGRLQVNPEGKYKKIGTGEFSVHWASGRTKTLRKNIGGKSEGWFGGPTWEPDPKEYGF